MSQLDVPDFPAEIWGLSPSQLEEQRLEHKKLMLAVREFFNRIVDWVKSDPVEMNIWRILRPMATSEHLGTEQQRAEAREQAKRALNELAEYPLFKPGVHEARRRHLRKNIPPSEVSEAVKHELLVAVKEPKFLKTTIPGNAKIALAKAINDPVTVQVLGPNWRHLVEDGISECSYDERKLEHKHALIKFWEERLAEDSSESRKAARAKIRTYWETLQQPAQRRLFLQLYRRQDRNEIAKANGVKRKTLDKQIERLRAVIRERNCPN